MQKLVETIDIEAPDHVVYDVITDLARYREWNPWILHAEGSVTPGNRVKVTLHMFGRDQVFDHRILATEKPHTFHWCDVGWFTAFAYGDRLRNIEALTSERCRYRVELRIEGIAERLTQWIFGRQLREGLHAETQALKAWAEDIHTQGQRK